MSRENPGTVGNFLGAADPAGDVTGNLLTAAGWMRMNSQADPLSGGALPLICKAAANVTTSRQFMLYWRPISSTFSMIVGDPAGQDQLVGAATIPLYTWTHVAAVKNGTTGESLTLYVNGLRDTGMTSGRTIQHTAHPLELGYRTPVVVAALNGQYAECALWDVALNASEILALAKGGTPPVVHPANLRAYYPCWGTTDAGEPDFSGRPSQNMVESGTVTVPPFHAPTGPYVHA